MTSFDIAIVGAGHTGAALALGLTRQGFDVILCDAEPLASIMDEQADGRSLALLAGSREILEGAGVWPVLDRLGEPIWFTEVVDTGSDARVVYDARSAISEPFGYGFVNRALRQTLLHAFLDMAPSRFRHGRVAGLSRAHDRVTLTLEDAQTGRESVTARVVIGADGRRSKMRALAGIGLQSWVYDQTALAFVIEHDLPHEGYVRERLRPGGPVATLPLAGRRTGVTLVERHARATALRADSLELGAMVGQAFGEHLGAIRIASPIGAWPLSAQHAKRYVAPRVALVGDAAHGVHPIHAQGLNMGIGDVGSLLGILGSAARTGGDPGSADLLIAYERDRRIRNWQRIWLTDNLNRIFSNDIAPVAAIRGAGLRAIERFGWVKARAIHEGTRTH